MKLAFFVILLIIIIKSVSSQVLCLFAQVNGLYTCTATIINPLGLNNFTQVEGIHFTGGTDEDVVRIERNAVSNTLNFPSIFCNQFGNTESIIIDNIGIERIDENAFADCRDLEYLLLQSNRLREIHENAFSENLQLSILDLSNNQLIRLPGNLFRNQINLYFLQLASNQLQELPSDIFNQLSELGMLNLDSNQLQDLPEGIFDNLPNLYYLSFSFNQIVKLRENLIDKLYSIQNFLAPFNQIIYIPRNFFDGNPYLSSIIISGNNLTILELNPIPMLSDFWFEHNQINAIDERIFNNVTLRSLNGGPNPCADRNGIISNPTNDDIRAALHRCFDNFNPIETTTTPGEEITKPTTEPNGCEVGNIEERICQLEAENAELRARLEYLEKIVLGR